VNQDCEGALRAFISWQDLPYIFTDLEEQIISDYRLSGDPVKAITSRMKSDPTLMEIVWNAYYEGWKQSHKVSCNRSQRRIFACTSKWFRIAKKGDPRGHQEWLNIPNIWKVIRGYVGPEMKNVSFYKGVEHIVDDEVRSFIRPALSYLLKCKLINLETEVYLGAVPGDYGTLWKPREVLGSVKDLMISQPTTSELELLNAWL